jgi:alkylated DNA repair dioxygenase AlkB
MASLLQSGAIRIAEGFLPDADALYSHMAAAVAWDDRMRARKAASFGVPYNYSGIEWPAAPFPDYLLPVLERLTAHLGYRCNNCLAHYYPGRHSTMGFHTDATDALIPGTGIAVLSLGAERAITFRHMRERGIQESYPLPAGSLLYMCPEMQLAWKHGILPAEHAPGGRISLTFRCMKQTYDPR